MNGSIMAFSNLQEAFSWGKMISKSQFCPTNYIDKPEEIIIAVQYGAELGLKPLQSLHNIAVINGKPTVYGDAMLAICKASTDFEYIKEVFEKTEEGLTAVCEVKRKGEPIHTISYSEKDAQDAGLLNRNGPWKTNRKRMLQFRARGFAIRDVFPHLLKGLISFEEAQDYPKVYVERAEPEIDKDTGEIIESKETPPPAMVTEEILEEIASLVAHLQLSDEKVSVWLKKLGVNYANDLTVDQADRMLGYLKKTALEKAGEENV